MTAYLEINDAGLMTTIQDKGRYGYQAAGIPVSGALDFEQLQIANCLVGNDLDMAGFEIRLQGPVITVQAEQVTIALTGTQTPIELISPIKGQVAAYRSVKLERGQSFRIGTIADSAVCYLAIKGGVDIPKVFNSYSTCMAAGLGGYEGRRLLQGDTIAVQDDKPKQDPLLALPQDHIDALSLNPSARHIRVILGPQSDYFSDDAINIFLGQSYRISQETNRMGARLDGHAIDHLHGFNIASDGIVKGAIQVPGNGLPIILLADCQTTGGYPKIATVISTDLCKIGRMMPGSDFQFQAVTIVEAEAIANEAFQKQQERLNAIRKLDLNEMTLDQRLFAYNLISGYINADGQD